MQRGMLPNRKTNAMKTTQTDSVMVSFVPVRYRSETIDDARWYREASRPFRARFADGYRSHVMPGASDEAIDTAMDRLTACSPAARGAMFERIGLPIADVVKAVRA